MEEIKETPILKFNENQLYEVRKNVGYEDVNKLKQDIEHLEDWIKKQNHYRIKDFDRDYLERLLIYNKGSVERAKQRFDKLCTCTNLMPEYLQNFDIKNEFHHLFTIANVCFLPKPTKENYRVLMNRMTGVDDFEFQMISYYRYILMMGHYVLNNDYCHGYEIVADSRKLTFDILSKCNPIAIHKVITLLMEAMGKRIIRFHMISGTGLFDALLSIVKQGLTAKIRQRLILHPTFESLYEYIPKENLPKDFGGEEKTMKEFTESNFKEMSSDEHIARVKFMEKCSTDESCRLACKFNEEYSGMPGSFKVLSVD